MDTLVNLVKQKTLLAMYRSVDRMNRHIVDGNPDGVISEQHLQMQLRSNFEDLSNEPKTSANR